MIRLAVLAVLISGTAWAAPPPGASTCSGCHGPASAPIPALAGREEGEIVAAMEEFRAGTRPATLMNRLVRGFSPEEVRAIAAWWAAQK